MSVCEPVSILSDPSVSLAGPSAISAGTPRVRRILHVLKHCGYGNGNVNVAIDLACVQAEAGCEVAVASAGGVFEPLLEQYGVRHYAIQLEQSRPLAALGSLLRLIRFVHAFKPDVIHAHMMGAAVIGRIISLLMNIPLVTTVHNSFDKHSWIMRLGHRVVAVSEAERRSLLAKGYSAKSLEVVRNAPVNSPREPFYVNPVDPQLKSPAVLTVCGLHPRKGVRELLEAWSAIAADRPGWTLYIAGEGPDREVLESLATALGLKESVVFLGFLPAPQPLYQQAEVFVLASHADPCSLVIGEARGAGCAIVATSVGGTPEMLEFGRKGVLVPPQDPKALADALGGLLRDTARRKAFRAEAFDGAEDYQVKNLFSRYEQVYLKALKLPPQRALEHAD